MPSSRFIGLTVPMVLSALCTGAIFSLQWRYGFNWGDEGLLWYISQRTALGQVPLRDFFSYDPGRYYWSAFFFKVLHGNGLLEQIVANAAFGAVGLAVASVAAARAAVARPWRLAMLLTLGIMLGFPRHKICEQALSLICGAGLAFLMARPNSQNRWLGYGIATGVAAFVGRNSGVYFVIAGLLLILLLKLSTVQLSAGRALLFAGLGIIIGYSPMIFMLCFVHGFAPAFYRSVVFTPSWQHQLPIPFPWHVHLKGLSLMDALQARAVSILCLAVPTTYLFAIWKWTRRNTEPALQLSCAASLAGVPFLHHAFDRADFFHIAQGIVPFAVVIAALASHFAKTRQRTLSFGISSAALALILLAWLPYEPAIHFLRMKPYAIRQLSISGRQFYVEADQAQVMQTIQVAFSECGSRDGTFLQAPYYPGLYPFLKTRAPYWELYYLYPRDNAFQEKHIDALRENNVSLVLLNRKAAVDGIDGLRIDRTYPKLVNYILENYQRSHENLPDGFEMYYSPQACGKLQ
jgi:hypothetical protein